MTSREFYRAMDRVLKPALEGQGFTRLKAGSSAWIKPLRDKYVMLHVYKGVKHSYLKPIGGTFEVWFALVDSANVSAAHSETSISFLRYKTDSELTELKQVRQHVLQKILNKTEFESEFERSLLELNRPLLQSSLNSTFNRRQPRALEYLDTEDVALWANFIAKIVPPAFDGIAREGELALSPK